MIKAVISSQIWFKSHLLLGWFIDATAHKVVPACWWLIFGDHFVASPVLISAGFIQHPNFTARTSFASSMKKVLFFENIFRCLWPCFVGRYLWGAPLRPRPIFNRCLGFLEVQIPMRQCHAFPCFAPTPSFQSTCSWWSWQSETQNGHFWEHLSTYTVCVCYLYIYIYICIIYRSFLPTT